MEQRDTTTSFQSSQSLTNAFSLSQASLNSIISYYMDLLQMVLSLLFLWAPWWGLFYSTWFFPNWFLACTPRGQVHHRSSLKIFSGHVMLRFCLGKQLQKIRSWLVVFLVTFHVSDTQEDRLDICFKELEFGLHREFSCSSKVGTNAPFAFWMWLFMSSL